MPLYDLYTVDNQFVDTMTRAEIMKQFGISEWVFYRILDNGDLIDGKYWIDDSESDIKARKHKDKELFKQFDILAGIIRRAVGWEN